MSASPEGLSDPEEAFGRKASHWGGDRICMEGYEDTTWQGMITKKFIPLLFSLRYKGKENCFCLPYRYPHNFVTANNVIEKTLLGLENC